MSQADNEAFPAFCNRVSKEAKHCNFKCDHEDCTVESTAIRDQIIIGTTHDKIREEALKNSRDLQKLRREGMQIESATKGVDELSGENPINKMGKYSYRNMNKKPQGKPKACYYCGQEIKASVIEHVQKCRARTSKCNFCNATRHYESVCRKKRAIKELKSEDLEESQQDDAYNINIFRITEKSQHQPQYDVKHHKDDFKVQLVVNNSLATALADTGASISVCGKKEAKQWNLVQKMVNTNAKIKPYDSPAIPVAGIAKCAVTFGSSTSLWTGI